MQKTFITIIVSVMLTSMILIGSFVFWKNFSQSSMNKEVDIQKDVDEMMERKEEEFVKSEIVSEPEQEIDDCGNEEKWEALRNEADKLNKTEFENTIYKTDEIAIDLGKYGFKLDGDMVVFGGYIPGMPPCSLKMYRRYNLKKIDYKNKDDLIKFVKSEEYVDEIEGREIGSLKLKEVKVIDSFDIVLWEEWSPYPSYTLYAEIIGKKNNFLISIG